MQLPELALRQRLLKRPETSQESGRSRWEARPLVALGLRVSMALVPALAAVLVTIFLDQISDSPTNWPEKLVTWALLLGVSTIVALAVEHRMRGLLPLALLLRMTLVFPDEAPSRYAIARAANSPAKIKALAAAGNSARSAAATQVLALVASLAKHDRYTRGHSERVRVFTDLIAAQMGISGPERDKLAWGALLHDIGKMTVPGTLLNKPGKPTDDEWAVLKGHPAAGGEFVAPLLDWLGPWVGGITEHHERYDGRGYPRGLAAEQITLAGRIVAVADSYETMTAARSYKKPMSASAARKELIDCAGAHFDPDVVRAFLAVSLPTLMWGIGPLSFLLQLPFLAQAESIAGQFAAAAGSAAAPAAAAAAVGAASVVTAGVVAAAPAQVPTRANDADVVTTIPATSAGSATTANVSRSGAATTAHTGGSSASPTRVPSAGTTKSVPVVGAGKPTKTSTSSSTTNSAPTTSSSTTEPPTVAATAPTTSSSGNAGGNGNANGNGSGSSTTSGSGNGNSGNSGKGNGGSSSSPTTTSTSTSTSSGKGKGKASSPTPSSTG
jgi:HD-GYP domain-containing protein (c-di-GMP phosphodiesterase class II)